MGAAPKLEPIVDVVAGLKSCLLFQGADDAILNFAAQNVELISYAKGDPVILENETSDHVYFVLQGAAEIISYVSNEKRVQRLALLKPGFHFADFSVLTKTSKSGSAYAYQDSKMFRMAGAKYLEMLQRFPKLSRTLAMNLVEMTLRTETLNEFIPLYHPDQLNLQRQVADMLPKHTWKKFGIVPLNLKSGVLSVAMVDPHKDDFFQFVKPVLPSASFVAYLVSDSALEGVMDHVTNWLKAPQSQHPPQKTDHHYADLAMLLKDAPLFRELPDNVRAQLASFLKPIEIKAGQLLLSPGALVDGIIVLMKGSLCVTHPIAGSKAHAHVVNLVAGESFGEMNVLSGKPSLQQIRALDDTTYVSIPKAVVEQLMGSPLFTIPLAQSMILRLQRIGHNSGIRYFKDADNIDFYPLLNLLPHNLIAEEKVLPLRLVDGEVAVGMVHLDSTKVTSAVARYLVDYRIRILGITEEQFRKYHNQFKSLADQAGPGTKTNFKATQVDPTKVLNDILREGMHNRASDIHFEPFEHHFSLRYRVDGVMVERAEKVPFEMTKEIIGRLKVQSNMDISQHKIPQDGQLKVDIGEQLITARTSALPTKYGEKIVLRLIRAKSSVVPLNMLAPDRRTTKILQSIAGASQGLFLVTGPTGSGKTTTLYSLLNDINRVDVNVVTLEEPVEMEVAGFNQVEIERKRGLDFGVALRSVLRQDPDVVMVGEIRDEETAKIVFEAAITGHLVLSTLHTTTSLDVAPRLHELGIPYATMAAGLLGVLTQRLVRGICKVCATNKAPTASEKEFVHSILGPNVVINDELKVGKGCPSCNNSGYFDRIPVLEIWRATLPMRRALIEGGDAQQMMDAAHADGYETLLEFGLKMALAGLTTIEEVKRCLSTV